MELSIYTEYINNSSLEIKWRLSKTVGTRAATDFVSWVGETKTFFHLFLTIQKAITKMKYTELKQIVRAGILWKQ